MRASDVDVCSSEYLFQIYSVRLGPQHESRLQNYYINETLEWTSHAHLLTKKQDNQGLAGTDSRSFICVITLAKLPSQPRRAQWERLLLHRGISTALTMPTKEGAATPSVSIWSIQRSVGRNGAACFTSLIQPDHLNAAIHILIAQSGVVIIDLRVYRSFDLRGVPIEAVECNPGHRQWR